MRAAILVLAVFGAILPATLWAAADAGVRGHASHRGKLVEGVEVRVYAQRPGTFGPFSGETPVARARTAADGTYRIALPAGKYIVEGLLPKKGPPGARPAPGDLYSLHAGSPVDVAAGRWTTAILPLTETPAEKRSPAKESRIKGRLLYEGKPLEKAYLYVFGSKARDYRAMADVVQPVRDGAFSLRLPPGSYVLAARKRQRGGPLGPIEKGDLAAFYPHNPVRVEEGVEIVLDIPLSERHEEAEGTEPRGLRVKVTDAAGKPIAGRHVLAYAQAARTGPPAAASAPTDAQGETVLPLPPGAVHLRARSELGGPLGDDEPHADATVQEDKLPKVLVLRLGAAR